MNTPAPIKVVGFQNPEILPSVHRFFERKIMFAVA